MIRSKSASCVALLWGLTWLLVAPTAPAATPQEVNRSIDRGVSSLYSRQRNGHWEQSPTPRPDAEGRTHAHSTTWGQWGGLTAIATYSLLAAGESPQDPRLKQAISFLQQANIQGTYALAMRAQVWPYLPRNAETRKAAERDAIGLVNALRSTGNNRGMFRYLPSGTDYDHSASNYGVLGIWAAAQMNLELPNEIWAVMDTAWRRNQMPDGGWCYVNGSDNGEWRKSTLSMTTAGVATLFITQDYLYADRGIKCIGNIHDENIDRGMAWMAKNFNEYKTRRQHYTLYNIERIGVASGHKYIGTIDWYREGAAYLVNKQSWGDIQDTCWGILFLVRGRAPVMMNKLEYTVETRGEKEKLASWNERPRDVANIVNYVGRQIEKDLNWQIVNLRVNVDDLHDAPILFIAGKEALAFSTQDEAKLKDFVEQGGMIVGNPDCDSAAFATSFRRLGTKLFGGEFQELPEDHPIYTAQQYFRKNWRSRPSIQSINNGCRELMILLNRDPARGWQVQAFGGPDREPHAQAMANIFLYSVSKQNLRQKGETFIVRPDRSTPERSINLARLEYASNWDPEPGGWRRLGAIMHNTFRTGLKVTPVKLGDGRLSADYKVAHLTGTGRLMLNEKARDEMKKYVEGGGTLIIDAAGGAPEFGVDAQRMIEEMFGGAMTQLAIDHAIFKSGYTITEVEYRPWARKLLGNLRQPRLKAMMVNNRPAVILSAEDLSVGMVGNPVDGITGYIPTHYSGPDGRTRFGATEIMANTILHAAGLQLKPQGAAPAQAAR
jgi:hypothetical protein